MLIVTVYQNMKKDKRKESPCAAFRRAVYLQCIPCPSTQGRAVVRGGGGGGGLTLANEGEEHLHS
jgi:hypothetical protein